MLFLEDASVPKNWKENFLSMFWSLESKLSFLLRNVHAYLRIRKHLEPLLCDFEGFTTSAAVS
jgi:hypothetical protein